MKLAVHMFNTEDVRIKSICDKSGDICPERLPVGRMTCNSSTDVLNIIKSITHIAGGSKIEILRAMSHGDAGIFIFPGLFAEHLVSNEYSKLKTNQIFSPTARFEIHGCGVASETSIVKPGSSIRDPKREDCIDGRFIGRSNGRGLVYLRKVARVLGVTVAAAINAQGINNMPWRFEGPTITVQPNGDFRYDSDETRDWDIEGFSRAARLYLERIIKSDIRTNNLSQARNRLQQLIKDYPHTEAAKEAANRLGDVKLRSGDEILTDKYGFDTL